VDKTRNCLVVILSRVLIRVVPHPRYTAYHEICRNLIIFGTSVPLSNLVEIGQEIQHLLKGARETRPRALSHKYCFLRTQG